jgi:excisionase family DNA binding protein
MELLTVKETAEMLRVSTVTVRRYIASGKLAAVRVGRNIRIRRMDAEGVIKPSFSGIDPRFVGKSEEWPLENHPLFKFAGVFEDPGGKTDIAENHDKYLAEAYADLHEDVEEVRDNHITETTAHYSQTGKSLSVIEDDTPNDIDQDPSRFLREAYAVERQGKVPARSKFADKSDEWILKNHPLLKMIGIASDREGKTDIAENHDYYLAEAYSDTHEE